MAALVITPGDVLAGADASKTTVVWGGNVTQGMALVRNPADSKYGPARANTAGTAHVDGIALTAGTNNQPGIVCTAGDIALGATLAVGQVYCLSDAVSGEIVPHADLGTGDYIVVIGIAETTSNLIMEVDDPGVVKA